MERTIDRSIWGQNRVETWEGHLVLRAQSGDALAFEMLVEMHEGAIRAHASRLLRNQDDAQDAVQETFIKAFRALGGFDARRKILPWLMRICSNCCIDIVRERKRRADSLDAYDYTVADEETCVAEDVEARSMARRIEAAIARLPERYRQIIQMRHLDHMAVAEIAAATGAPEGTVKSWLFRARAMLAADLQIQA